eukprot:g3347.t1
MASCLKFELDVTKDFGTCKCGAPKSAHSKAALQQGSHRRSSSVTKRCGLAVTDINPEHLRRTAHVGGGSYGQVYKASLSFGGVPRIVAVKTFTTNGPDAGLDSHAVTCAVREAKVMQKLRHPNLVQIVGTVLTGQQQQGRRGDAFAGRPLAPSLVLEWVPQNLAQVAADETVSLEGRIWLVFDAACGLDALHKYKIVHHDVKTSNILVTAPGAGAVGGRAGSAARRMAKVADFGMSTVHRASRTTGASKAVGAGTCNYAAPEKLYTAASDVYAWALVAIATLTGEEPWVGLDQTEIVKKITNPFADLPGPALEAMLAAAPQMRAQIDIRNRRPPVPDACPLVAGGIEKQADWNKLVPAMLKIVHLAWQDHPEDRPTFEAVVKHFIVHVLPNVSPVAEKDHAVESHAMFQQILQRFGSLEGKVDEGFEQAADDAFANNDELKDELQLRLGGLLAQFGLQLGGLDARAAAAVSDGSGAGGSDSTTTTTTTTTDGSDGTPTQQPQPASLVELAAAASETAEYLAGVPDDDFEAAMAEHGVPASKKKRVREERDAKRRAMEEAAAEAAAAEERRRREQEQEDAARREREKAAADAERSARRQQAAEAARRKREAWAAEAKGKDEEATAGKKGGGGGGGSGVPSWKAELAEKKRRKKELEEAALQAAQQWRGGEVPQWAMAVPLADLETARATIAASSGDDKGGKALYDAASEGKEGEAKALIAAGANVQWTKKEFRDATALYIAAGECTADPGSAKTAIALALIEAGSNVNYAGSDAGRTPLWLVACAGNLKVVSVLIEAGATVDLAMKDGGTPLCIAAQEGNAEVVSVLIKEGKATVDLVAMKDGGTPLCIAAHQGNAEVVSVLIKEGGATVDLADKNGVTPLLIAAQEGNAEVVSVLIKGKATVDLADKDGRTPLFIAAQEGNLKVVSVLLEAGATVDLANKDGTTPLFIAALKGHDAVVSMLIKEGKATVDLANKNGTTPLFIAAQQGHHEVVSVLIKEGKATVDLADKDGVTPLLIAAQEGHHKVVSVLIEAGATATVDLANKDGMTPLFIAASRGYDKVVSALIDGKAKVDLANKDGVTPLYSAAELGHAAAVSVLVKEGSATVDLATPDERGGATPLWVAAFNGRKAVVERLVRAGADPAITDKREGETPRQAAERTGHRWGDAFWRGDFEEAEVWAAQQWRGGEVPQWAKEVPAIDLEQARALVAASSDGDDKAGKALYDAADNGNEGEARALIVAGANVDYVSGHDTPLYQAASRGYGKVVSMLLEAGATVDLADKDGWTPLFIAAWKGHDEVVSVLIEEGKATVDLAKKNGATPLFIAAQKGHDKAVSVLIEKGKATVDLAKKSGATPLHSAAKEGRRTVVELLLKHGADQTLEVFGKTPRQHAEEEGHEWGNAFWRGDFEEAERWQEQHDLEQARALVAASSGGDDKAGKALWGAAKAGKEGMAKALIAAGANVNWKNVNGSTPLLIAAHKGYDEVVSVLIKEGKATVDLATKDGRTPLFIATAHGHDKVISVLIKEGKATVDLADKDGRTPLFMAARNGHDKVVSVLIEEGKATVDLAKTKGKGGETPLCMAAYNGKEAACKVLLKAGADPAIKDDDGKSARDYGRDKHGWGADFWRGDFEEAEAWQEEEESEAKDEPAAQEHLPQGQQWRGGRLPQWAKEVPAADLENARATVAASSDGDDKGGKALYDAAEAGNEGEVRALIVAGASVQWANKHGWTATHIAAQKGHAGIVAALAVAGADVDHRETELGYTPLIVAASNGRGKVVSVLVEEGEATVDLANKDGGTPLHMAAFMGNQAVCELLLKHGADPAVKDNRGETARQWAEGRGLKWGDAFWQRQ